MRFYFQRPDQTQAPWTHNVVLPWPLLLMTRMMNVPNIMCIKNTSCRNERSIANAQTRCCNSLEMGWRSAYVVHNPARRQAGDKSITRSLHREAGGKAYVERRAGNLHIIICIYAIPIAARKYGDCENRTVLHLNRGGSKEIEASPQTNQNTKRITSNIILKLNS